MHHALRAKHGMPILDWPVLESFILVIFTVPDFAYAAWRFLSAQPQSKIHALHTKTRTTTVLNCSNIFSK